MAVKVFLQLALVGTLSIDLLQKFWDEKLSSLEPASTSRAAEGFGIIKKGKVKPTRAKASKGVETSECTPDLLSVKIFSNAVELAQRYMIDDVVAFLENLLCSAIAKHGS